MEKLQNLRQLFREVLAFAKANKIWWFMPVVILILLIGLLVAASQLATPFLYTFF